MGTDRRLVLYVAPGDPDTNVFAVFTPIRGDYTAVSSFGTLEQVMAPVLGSQEKNISSHVLSYVQQISFSGSCPF